MANSSSKTQGFTLLETAIVVLIIGLALSAFLVLSSGIHESAKHKLDKEKLQDIKTALLNYAAEKGTLPCPDTSGDGKANDDDDDCEAGEIRQGYLPYITLGTHKYNAYQQPFFYVVHGDYTKEDKAEKAIENFLKDSNALPDAITICSEINADECAANKNLIEKLPVVVVSFGQNSAQTWGTPNNGTPACPNSLSANERFNCNSTDEGKKHLVLASQSSDFDDVLMWLSRAELAQKVSFEKEDETNTVLASYDFANMTPDEIQAFLDNPETLSTKGTTTKTDWSSNAIDNDVEGNPQTVLSPGQTGERNLLIAIPDEHEYVIRSMARLSGTGNPNETGGYGIYFDTLINTDMISEGYILQFDGGYGNGELVIRRWNGNNEGSVVHRFNDRNLIPTRQDDPNWWIAHHEIEFKVTTVSSTDTELSRQIEVKLFDYNSATEEWDERFTYQYDYTVNLFAEDAKLYTGYRTWGSYQTYFYRLDIEKVPE